MIRDDDDPLDQDQGQGQGRQRDEETAEAEVIDLDPARHRHANQPEADGNGGRDADELVLVDSPEAHRDGPLLTAGSVRAASRRPIIPPWARSWASLKTATGWLVSYWSHTLTY